MIAATLHGPNYFSPNDDEHSIEVFDHIGDAITALLDRYASNGRRPLTVNYLDGHVEHVLFPALDAGHYFLCYELDASGDYPLSETSILDALTVVHGGAYDWLVALDEGEATLAARVSRTY